MMTDPTGNEILNDYWAARALRMVPERYQGGFATLADAFPLLQPAIDRCKAWLDGEHEKGKGLYLRAKTGTGKTALAWALAQGFMERNQCEVLFYTTADLLDGLVAAMHGSADWGRSEGLVAACAMAPLLILDDLGTEKTSDFASRSLYQIINQRYSHLRETIVTSNMTGRELNERWRKAGDETWERITSRLSEMVELVELPVGEQSDLRVYGAQKAAL